MAGIKSNHLAQVIGSLSILRSRGGYDCG